MIYKVVLHMFFSYSCWFGLERTFQSKKQPLACPDISQPQGRQRSRVSDSGADIGRPDINPVSNDTGTNQPPIATVNA